MSRKHDKNDGSLTDDEVQFLRSGNVADEVKRFVTRQHDSIGVRTSAYRKIANAAKAERDALMEVRLLDLAKQLVLSEDEANNRVRALEADRAELLTQHEAMRSEVMRLTALPASAVSAHGSQR